MSISFTADPEGGLEIFDPIERHRYRLDTSKVVSPTTVSPERFRFPVDAAVRVTADAVELPTVVPVYVRDADGDVVGAVEHQDDLSLPQGRYELELNASIKLYLGVESSVAVTSDFEHVRVEFGEAVAVHVGGRSFHEHPAGTVTTTGDPEDVMAAVSVLGSALKTTSPERSYPTLRGHPPLLELGDELRIPPDLEPPETGIRLELPAELGLVYAAAPVAFYLGATVVPGERARLVTETGFVHPLDVGGDVEGELARLLQQVFFLDCLTRTEGLYEVDLHERRAVAPALDLEFDALYAASPAERVETYLGVPFETVEPHLPAWKLASHVAPEPESVELLSFLVDDLALVRTPRTTPPTAATDAPDRVAAIDEFVRSGVESRSDAGAGSAAVRPESMGTTEQAWVGAGAPRRASKATVEAFRNRLDRPPGDGDVDITVVCNDPAMNAEREVLNRVYGSRAELPFDVHVHRGLTTAELRDVLEAETDFLHYIGHIDAEGFQCADGRLDVRTLDSVGVDAFLLNACQSYDQGMALVEAGAIAGVVTLADVVNSGAVAVGSTMARLLNAGFPLRAALGIAREESVVGGQYTVVGDGGFAVVQASGGTPYLCTAERTDDGFRVELTTYPTSESGMGSMVMPYVEHNHEYFLSSGTLEPFQLSPEEFERFLASDTFPVRTDGRLRWSDDLSDDRLGQDRRFDGSS